jgi:hypothetical protein
MGQAHALINLLLMLWPTLIVLPLGVAVGTGAVNPVGSARLALGAYLAGLTLFLIAKVSLFRSGRFVSFGSSRMRPPFRALYRTGYVLMAVGVLFAVGLLIAQATPAMSRSNPALKPSDRGPASVRQ